MLIGKNQSCFTQIIKFAYFNFIKQYLVSIEFAEIFPPKNFSKKNLARTAILGDSLANRLSKMSLKIVLKNYLYFIWIWYASSIIFLLLCVVYYNSILSFYKSLYNFFRDNLVSYYKQIGIVYILIMSNFSLVNGHSKNVNWL